MGRKVIYFIIFSVLVLAVSLSAIFYILQIKIINADLKKVNEYAKSVVVSKKKDPVYLRDFSRIRENLISAESDFLEVNLSDMKTYFYRAGSLEKEFPILAKGDPQEWGGSASGLYRAMSGNKISYSIIAEVYMPFALHYYGKYYIHGEPYYQDGSKRYTDVTGGCIQLSDEDAKAVFNLAKIDMPFLVIDRENDNYQYPAKKNTKFPEVSAKSYLVADLDSGLVFAQKDSEKQLLIASLVKLMTAVTVAENVDLRRSVQITSQMLEADESAEGLAVGKNFRVVELFYPLLTESSNGTAQALSYFLGHEKSIELMNEKAKAILMENTIFTSPDGFSSGNISTSQDIFYLTRYILNNRPLLWEITKGNDVKTFGGISFKNLNNGNLFFGDQNFVGGKTDYIAESGDNGIFIFKFLTKDNSERKVAIILLGTPNLGNGSENLKSDTEKIINWLKENYFGGN